MSIIKSAELVFANIEKIKPIVHNISNIVTANDCANITLAAGGAPTMASEPDEVVEITKTCSAFVINMGTYDGAMLTSMVRAGAASNEVSHPVIFDPVGAGAAKKRNKCAKTIMDNVKPTVIRGNISEIKFLGGAGGGAKGVDADENDRVTDKSLDATVDFAKKLSAKTGAVIAISGEIDIIADSERAFAIKNGCAMMARVTGTGCMLSSLLGVFCGANPNNILEATAVCVSAYGYAGELAYARTVREDGGTGMFHMHLIDYMSKMNYSLFKEGAKIENR